MQATARRTMTRDRCTMERGLLLVINKCSGPGRPVLPTSLLKVPLLHWNDFILRGKIYTITMDLIPFLIDFILHIDTHLNLLIEQYGVWTYLLLFLIVYVETGAVVTPFLPGDSLL